jgi:hypothetical protein
VNCDIAADGASASDTHFHRCVVRIAERWSTGNPKLSDIVQFTVRNQRFRRAFRLTLPHVCAIVAPQIALRQRMLQVPVSFKPALTGPAEHDPKI